MSAIFDLDGTLIMHGVQPNHKVIAMCNSTPDVYIVTGRQEKTRSETEQLLHQYGVNYKALLMNDRNADKSSQIHSKRANAQKVLAQGPVEFAVDDDAVARSLYKSMGINRVMGP